MSAKPSDIRIADLARPVLTPAQTAAVEYAETQRVHFDVETILAAARAKTGLADFGRDDFRARLAIQCQSIDEDAAARRSRGYVSQVRGGEWDPPPDRVQHDRAVRNRHAPRPPG